MVHGFSIPHHKAVMTAGDITVEVPKPPERSGSLLIPDQARDIVQHNIVCGKILKMGPLAFTYKDTDGSTGRTEVKEGDWAIFRPFAGTMIQPDGKVGAVGGIRYLSSFRDVLAVIPSEDMMEAEAFLRMQKASDAEDAAKREAANREAQMRA